MKRLICLAVIALFGVSAAVANIAPPKTSEKKNNTTSKSVQTILSVQLQRDATEAKLIIPKAYLKELRAELDELDDESENTAGITGEGLDRTRTIVSGMFLSLALVFGGIWFVRSGKAATSTTKTLVVGATVSAIAAATTLVYANAGPPPDATTINGKMFSTTIQSWGYGYGKIKLETKADGDQKAIVLIVPNPSPKPTASE